MPTTLSHRWRRTVLAAALLLCARPVVTTARAQEIDTVLQAEVQRMLDALPARTSLHALHVPTGRTVAVRADLPMNTMSVIKIAIMLQAYRDAEQGRVALNERVTVREEDLRKGSGTLKRAAVGRSLTIQELLDQMIITSDNTATDLILRRVDRDRINATLRELGLSKTRLVHSTAEFFRRLLAAYDPAWASRTDPEVFRGMLPPGPARADTQDVRYRFTADTSQWLGRSTAREMSTLLEGILAARFASRATSDLMLEHLKGQTFNRRLPAILRDAPSTAILHKTGDFPPVSGSDVGIIQYPGGPIVVSVFTNSNTGDFSVLERTIGEIAARLVDAWK